MRKIEIDPTWTMVQEVPVMLEDGVKLVYRYFEYESPTLFDLIREIATRAGMSMEAVREAAHAETWKNARVL